MIAPMAQMFLFGTEIDYETSLLESGFKFRNPAMDRSLPGVANPLNSANGRPGALALACDVS